MVEFHLYNVPKRMTLYDFWNVCKVPFKGSINEPCPRETLFLKLLWGKREGCLEREWLVYIFMSYAIIHYLLRDV